MSLKSFIFSRADKPVVKEKEIDHTYKIPYRDYHLRFYFLCRLLFNA